MNYLSGRWKRCCVDLEAPIVSWQNFGDQIAKPPIPNVPEMLCAQENSTYVTISLDQLGASTWLLSGKRWLGGLKWCSFLLQFGGIIGTAGRNEIVSFGRTKA